MTTRTLLVARILIIPIHWSTFFLRVLTKTAVFSKTDEKTNACAQVLNLQGNSPLRGCGVVILAQIFILLCEKISVSRNNFYSRFSFISLAKGFQGGLAHLGGLLLACVFWVSPCQASIEVREFTNNTERHRYESFIEDMRCPKCQNQNLAGSDSPIAKDLRNELYLQIQEGRSDKEIVDFMVERYGDFILYKPRLTPATLLLWGLPLVLLVVGAGVLVMIVRRRRVQTPTETGLSADEADRLNALLAQNPLPTDSSKESQ